MGGRVRQCIIGIADEPYRCVALRDCQGRAHNDRAFQGDPEDGSVLREIPWIPAAGHGR